MKNYERVTPHDRVEMLNFNQHDDMTRFYMYALRCFDLENQIENGELLMREETINTTVVTYLQTKIQDLEKENAELKARLEKAVELPCKVGDTVYSIENLFGNALVILKGRCDYVAYEDTTVPRVTVWATFEDEWMLRPRKFYGKGLNNLFTSHVKAEQRLAELQRPADYNK